MKNPYVTSYISQYFQLICYLAPLSSYCELLIKFLLSTRGVPLFNVLVRGKPPNPAMRIA